MKTAIKHPKFRQLTVKQLTILEILASIMFVYLLYAMIKPILIGKGCWGYPLFGLWVWMDVIMIFEKEKWKR